MKLLKLHRADFGKKVAGYLGSVEMCLRASRTLQTKFKMTNTTKLLRRHAHCREHHRQLRKVHKVQLHPQGSRHTRGLEQVRWQESKSLLTSIPPKK